VHALVIGQMLLGSIRRWDQGCYDNKAMEVLYSVQLMVNVIGHGSPISTNTFRPSSASISHKWLGGLDRLRVICVIINWGEL